MLIRTKTAQRHIAFFDVHVPHNIDLDHPLKFVQDYKPTHFIMGGDFLNLEFASHWNEAVFKHIGLTSLRKALLGELDAGKKVLRAVASALPTDCVKFFIPGNHESWLWWASVNHGLVELDFELDRKMMYKSDLAKLMNAGLASMLTRELELEKVGFKCLDYNQELRIGRISYFHGHQFSTPSSSIRRYPNRNVVFGHHHSHNVVTLHNSGENDRAIQHTAVPCMTHLSPGYLKDGSTRWLNGFWLADVLPNGLFDGRVKKVLGGKVMVP